jgi:methylenetetrahydrofolate reductase (NADPH)
MNTPRNFSFEFFPPKTPEGADKLRVVRARLAALRPQFFSVTFGAGGSTREGTWNTVTEIARAGLAVAPHISCIGTTRADVARLIGDYQAQGIRRLVALRGDMPSGAGAGGGDFRYANELVEFIRAKTGDWFHIEVAAYPEFHPQARSADEDLRNFARKVAAGANSAITQYFYNSDAYFGFVEEAQKLGVEVPIVPGIMPITNFSQLARFSDACGAEIPRWIRLRLQGFGDDRESIRAFGLDVVTDLCDQLLAAGAPGLHFYTMNQAEPTLELWSRLNLPAGH